MDWSWSLNPLTTEDALAKRAEWERCAPNAYQEPDLQVLAFIEEIRSLRHFINTTPTAQTIIIRKESGVTNAELAKWNELLAGQRVLKVERVTSNCINIKTDEADKLNDSAPSSQGSGSTI